MWEPEQMNRRALRGAGACLKLGLIAVTQIHRLPTTLFLTALLPWAGSGIWGPSFGRPVPA